MKSDRAGQFRSNHLTLIDSHKTNINILDSSSMEVLEASAPFPNPGGGGRGGSGRDDDGSGSVVRGPALPHRDDDSHFPLWNRLVISLLAMSLLWASSLRTAGMCVDDPSVNRQQWIKSGTWSLNSSSHRQSSSPSASCASRRPPSPSACAVLLSTP